MRDDDGQGDRALRREGTPIEAAAAEWLVRVDEGLAPAGEAELNRWLAADERHARVFAELSQAWRLMDRVAEVRVPGTGGTDPALFAPRARRRGWRVPAALAAAAAVLLAAGWWHPWRGRTAPVQSAATEVGGLLSVNLPDGSTAQLNTDTRIDVSYTAAERRVSLLRGEACFTVAKNRARPFVIAAGGVSVRAVGTVFDVRVRQRAVEILVTEGQVGVNASGTDGPSPGFGATGTPMVVAGERAVIFPAAPAMVTEVTPAEIERALSWQKRRLEFNLMPLGRIVDEFNRYNEHKLVIADPQLARRLFGGTFKTDGYGALVKLLESNFGVRAERSDRQTVLYLAK